ncbi:unnamed protein product [Rotaria socialis]
MEAIYLKPFPIELFSNIMLPYSPASLSFNNYNSTATYSTSTLAQQLLVGISQSVAETNKMDVNFHDNHNSLVRYKTIYRNYHGIISSFVCIFGLTCNLFNIIVLTRPLMRSSTNTILTSLAISDLIKMLFVLPAAILFYCLQISERKSEPDFSSRFQVTFYMIQMLVALTLHCISTWLTVLLAAFRFVFLSCRSLTGYVSRPDRALMGVITVVVVSTILCVPSYVEHRIVNNCTNDTLSLPSYRFEETRLSEYLSLRSTVFVLHAVIFKLIPCILLLLFSFLLIHQLRSALAKAEIVQKHSATPINLTNNGRLRGRRHEKENRRTTLMLVIVCALFLITELPQGAILLLAFLSKQRSNDYYEIYQQLGDTFDILALINNSVNFILYCLMSRAFRDTFKQTFCISFQEIDHRDSRFSITQISVRKSQPEQLNTSIHCEALSKSKCSIYQRTSKPIVEENKNKKKKISLQCFNHLTTVPLLNDDTSNVQIGLCELIYTTKSNLPLIAHEKIYECHIAVGHSDRDKTWAEIKTRYAGIPQQAISIFIYMCDVCQTRRSFPKATSGKPIISIGFLTRLANIILNLKLNWPDLIITNGRPKYPQSQGLIERANAVVQKNVRETA